MDEGTGRDERVLGWADCFGGGRRRKHVGKDEKAERNPEAGANEAADHKDNESAQGARRAKVVVRHDEQRVGRTGRLLGQRRRDDQLWRRDEQAPETGRQ